MILLELRVMGFGRLRNLALSFAPGLTVIGGPNEAGKSTAAECIVRLLFGYPESQWRAPRNRFAPWSGPPHEATLAYRLDDGSEFETWRDFSREDVPTQTRDRATGRDIEDLSGSRRASPGATLFGLSLPAFEAAAVIRAAEFAESPDSGRASATASAVQKLSERLAELVGAAGDAGAVEALKRLDDFISRLGGAQRATSTDITRAHAQSAAARQALDDYQKEFATIEHALQRRVDLRERIGQLGAKQEKLAAQLSIAQLQVVKHRIARSETAEAALAHAQQSHQEVQAATNVAVGDRMQATEDALIAWKTASAEVESAQARAKATQPQHEEAKRAFSDALRALGQAKTRVTERQERLAELPDASSLPDVSDAQLIEIEALADRTGELEAEAERRETIAAFSRQRGRPAPLAWTLALVIGLIGAIGGYFAHLPQLTYGGVGVLVVAAVLFGLWATGGRRQTGDVAGAQRNAERAHALFLQAETELLERCRALGCKDPRAVRDAYEIKTKVAKLQTELKAAEQAAEECEAQRASWAEQLDVFTQYGRDIESANTYCAATQAELGQLLNELNIPPGGLDERVNAWRQTTTPGEQIARADAAVAQAERDRAQALSGKSLEELRAEEARLAEEIRSLDGRAIEVTTMPAEPTAPQTELQAQLERVKRDLSQATHALEGIKGELRTFAAKYPDGSTELEERLAICTSVEDRLKRARQAAELARDTIRAAQESVHRDFAPKLGEVLSASAAALTRGRYSKAFVDPANFAVNLIAPETARSVPVDELSSGTWEQIHLSLRAAVAQLLAAGERVPLILDDALAHADDDRLKAAIEHLAQMGEQGQQILLFSQRGSIGEIARGLGVTVVELAPPQK